MKVLLILFTTAVAAVQCSVFPTYSLPNPNPVPPVSIYGPPSPGPGTIIGGNNCGNGQIFHNGRCVTRKVNSHVYVFNLPNLPGPIGVRPPVPLPDVERNIIFVRLPDNQPGQGPVVVPPPEQKNIVYVLKKESQSDTDIIHVPSPPKSNPEVYLVSYGQGKNPILPTGEDLQTALSNNAQHLDGQVVEGGSSNTGYGNGGDSGNQGNIYTPPKPQPQPPSPIYSTP